ncbi:FAD synthase [Candidatus Woesearchaeota archaeon CG10_big_fil_rev_8_21_14_0_10_37_12]|nr:MAG: FAD synthase [Candidatus Woesearchaeota archaeon CG10_big_fil_rev_8_21_14_0_10_37_12]
MTKVLCTGTFDLLHKGHLNYFEQAKKLGNHLIVVVARDKTIEKERGILPIYNEKERLKKIAEQKNVDKARLGHEEDKLKVVEEERPDIILLGYDQKINKKELSKKLAQRGLHPKILRAKAYKSEQYKSSLLKKLINKVSLICIC